MKCYIFIDLEMFTFYLPFMYDTKKSFIRFLENK